MKLLCFVAIILLICVVIVQTNSVRSEMHKQAVLLATFRVLAEFNYKFMIDNKIDWDKYVNQLETTAEKKPLLHEGFYLKECKQQKQNLP
jgi:glucan phosphoethanolaminetransferase (alkaline phosphatase superfamily)